ncbi:hypothetical protein PVT67_01885 [Gallaecimonas kandeliae]|uniref:hypothetical protein n=1 Tax=Gallaecimonas kandeliae TaxID=3029055 RepID=UPI0026473627|nr:hypothetical protein [Gallaecimonas kandeliae]WKE66023.1 hypothetical protein PVT67_01885 [Gallaecimonas kandeliae]
MAVIVILGILAVAFGSRFMGNAGVTEVVDRDNALSLLRRVQTQAMQQADDSACHQLLVSAKSLALSDLAACTKGGVNQVTDLSLSLASGQFQLSAGGTVLSLPQTLAFDGLGNVPLCAQGCSLQIAGQGKAALCIEAQGYIHPC